jgi:hypothetical protein
MTDYGRSSVQSRPIGQGVLRGNVCVNVNRVLKPNAFVNDRNKTNDGTRDVAVEPSDATSQR